MALAIVSGQDSVQLWCARCSSPKVNHTEDEDGMIRVAKESLRASCLVTFADAAISVLMCEDRGTHLEYRYVF